MDLRASWSWVKVPHQMLWLLIAKLLAPAHAVDPNSCTTAEDTFVGNSEALFTIASWMSRGVCVRASNDDAVCYATLDSTLSNLISLRQGEYNGAASVLALLPTIGALLGAPTTEIWRLLTVVPFGGALAMTLSFGATILPVRVEEYENDFASGTTVTFRSKRGQTSDSIQDDRKKVLSQLIEKIEGRMLQDESQRLPKGHLSFGLLGMILLFIGAQAAMIVVEQGGVLPWWCVSRWWMHLWYFMVTITAIAENWAQLPFKETWKLFISDIPYDVTISTGDDVIEKLEKPYASVSHVLHDLGCLKAATLDFHGSQQYTRPRNAVLVMVSVIHNEGRSLRSVWQLLSKCTSIGTFVTGTAFFASVQLLALPMAVMTLTLVLAAGVFSRAVTGWIVSSVNKTEPMLHVIVNSTQEAQLVIARVLALNERGEGEVREDNVRKIQVELGGHVFVEQRRVAHRSPWHVSVLGVFSKPFDLRNVDTPKPSHKGSQESSQSGRPELGILGT